MPTISHISSHHGAHTPVQLHLTVTYVSFL